MDLEKFLDLFPDCNKIGAFLSSNFNAQIRNIRGQQRKMRGGLYETLIIEGFVLNWRVTIDEGYED